MSDGERKVIHSFGDRLALDQAVRSLAAAPNAYELDRRARELAQKGEGVAPALVRQLDTEDATLRGGLGLLAQYLDRSVITPALYQAAADTRRPPAARLTAIMILERYLNESIDAGLTQSLPPPAVVARASALEALAAAAAHPLVLGEYAEQLLAEPPEIVHAVIEVIAGIDDPQRARLLLAIACRGPVELSERILACLREIRHPSSLEALRVWQRLAPPSVQPAIARQAHKLFLAGVRTGKNALLRALWSPVNAQGQSLLWLITQDAEEAQPNLLILVLHDTLGLLQVSAQPAIEPSGLPLPALHGFAHRLRMPGSHHIIHMAEITPAHGLHLLDAALFAMQQAALPWPGELIAFGQWVWGREGLPAPAALPQELPAAASGDFAALLQHIAFAPWAWEIPDIDFLLARGGEEALIAGSSTHQMVAARLVSAEARVRLDRRLHTQVQWMLLIGDEETAALTAAARLAVAAGDVHHPFIQAFAWRSLLAAAADRASRAALRLSRKD